MSKLLFSLLFTCLVLAAHAGNPEHGTAFKVDPTQSSLTWSARKVTGQHSGLVNVKEGSLNLKDGILTGGSVVIDMTSISVTDIQGGGKAKLEGHLKSDDFFGVETYPTASIVITDVKSKGDGNYDIKANLTIKGITNAIEFPAFVSQDGPAVYATASLKVDRTLYNVRYGSGKFFENLGDSTIYDEFDLNIKLNALEHPGNH